MIDFTIRVTGRQYQVLKYVSNGCKEDDKRGDQSWFISHVNSLLRQRLIVHQHPKRPAYILSRKGKIILELIREEINQENKEND